MINAEYDDLVVYKLIDESWDKYYPKIIYNKSFRRDDAIGIRLEYKTFIIKGNYYYKDCWLQITGILIKKTSKILHRKIYEEHELKNYVYLKTDTKIVKEIGKNLPSKEIYYSIQDIFKMEDEYAARTSSKNSSKTKRTS